MCYHTKLEQRRSLLFVHSASANAPIGLHVISSANPHVYRVMALRCFRFNDFKIALLDFSSVLNDIACIRHWKKKLPVSLKTSVRRESQTTQV